MTLFDLVFAWNMYGQQGSGAIGIGHQPHKSHQSLNYVNPYRMHQRKRKPRLRWYLYKKVRYGNVQ
ncbi:MAG: hypothetical protein BGO59_26605 [Spirosoma sp. 48-14]|nr:MAG: hypothetical protein BGO59_26605 [Spirosoma sp. 48-14]